MMEMNETLNKQNIICVLPYNISEVQLIFYHDFSWWLEGFGSVLIGSLGIVFNATTISVLLGSELAASFFNWLLVCLALFDSLFLLNGILEAFRTYLGSTILHNYVFVAFLFPFRSVVLCCSIYMTVILALERYNALANPTSHQGSNFRGGQNSLRTYFIHHWARVLKYVGPIILLSSLFYIPKLMELHVVKIPEECIRNGTLVNCSHSYSVISTELRNNNHYILWYINVTNLVVTTIIPLVSLTYLNFNIYLKFKKYIQRQPSAKSNTGQIHGQIRKREKYMIQQTTILFVIVFLFALSHVLRIILNIEEFISLEASNNAREEGCDWLKFWTVIAAPVSHFLLQINCSINFFIYCFFNKSFRDALVSKLTMIINSLKFGRETDGTIDEVPHAPTGTASHRHKHEIQGSTNEDIEDAVELKDINPAIEEEV